MSTKFKVVAIASVAITSLAVAGAQPKGPSTAPASTVEASAWKPEPVKARIAEPAPLLWDRLDPKAIDRQTEAQRKQRALPKPMPAEIK
jgi:hypothetical protein